MAVVGKGGSGKSVVAGTMARILARRGHSVLALDSDLMPGLAFSLGAPSSGSGSLGEAVEKNEQGRWRLRKGIGPVRGVRRYAAVAPDGVRLLEAGKLTAAGLEPIMGSVNGFYQLVHRLTEARALDEWAFVGDLPAGPRQTAYDWAPYARLFLVVTEPTWKSALTARRIAAIARARGGATAGVVANKVSSHGDERRVTDVVGEAPIATIPADDAVAQADRRGVALIDDAPSSAALTTIEHLAERLADDSFEGVRVR